jgi:hypothetical protein
MPTLTHQRTRTPGLLKHDAADDAANRRISMRLFALPSAIERELGGHFFLGSGAAGEREMLAALRALGQTQGERT